MQNFKKDIERRLIGKLQQWKNGQKVFTVSNQYDEYILESAIMNVDGDKLDADDWIWWKNAMRDGRSGIMGIACALSDFDVCEE